MAGVDRIMFRTMKAATDGLPEQGRSRRTLGVKVAPVDAAPGETDEFDVYPDTEHQVAPGRGMSVAMDDPAGLPKHRKPRSLGGESRDPLFSIRVSAIKESLHVKEDHPPHALVEPASRCPISHYEAALAATRPSWEVRHV